MDGRMKYLAMRAKKMTARKDKLPNAYELRANFLRKGTEITKKEADILLEEVKLHRSKKLAKQNIRRAESKKKVSKKVEVKSKPKPLVHSRSYGKY